jgi:hypothetical protein
MSYDRQPILAEIARLRTERGLSLHQAAREALQRFPGLSPATIYRWASTPRPKRSPAKWNCPFRQIIVDAVHARMERDRLTRSKAIRPVLAEVDPGVENAKRPFPPNRDFSFMPYDRQPILAEIARLRTDRGLSLHQAAREALQRFPGLPTRLVPSALRRSGTVPSGRPSSTPSSSGRSATGSPGPRPSAPSSPRSTLSSSASPPAAASRSPNGASPTGAMGRPATPTGPRGET